MGGEVRHEAGLGKAGDVGGVSAFDPDVDQGLEVLGAFVDDLDPGSFFKGPDRFLEAASLFVDKGAEDRYGLLRRDALLGTGCEDGADRKQSDQ